MARLQLAHSSVSCCDTAHELAVDTGSQKPSLSAQARGKRTMPRVCKLSYLKLQFQNKRSQKQVSFTLCRTHSLSHSVVLAHSLVQSVSVPPTHSVTQSRSLCHTLSHSHGRSLGRSVSYSFSVINTSLFHSITSLCSCHKCTCCYDETK